MPVYLRVWENCPLYKLSKEKPSDVISKGLINESLEMRTIGMDVTVFEGGYSPML
jgi:hypothetical protein